MTEEAPKARPVRRRRTIEERRRIVSESFEAGASVSEVARRHGLNTNVLFTWRRRHGDLGSSAVPDQPSLLPAVLVEAASLSASPAMELAPAVASSPGRMEIVLSNDRRVIVDAGVGSAPLRLVPEWPVARAPEHPMA
jgi:transposase